VSQPLVAPNQYSQSKKFVALQQHTAHLTEKYEQLSANYEQHTAHLTEKYEQLLTNYEQHTAHLTEKYEQLSANYEQLR